MTSIILGVSGSVAAYKTPELVRLLKKEGFSVTPVLTANAKKFVTAHALAAVSHSRVYEQLFDGDFGSPHLELAKTADAFVIAPASANVIAKLANGHADDLLSTLFLSFEGPRIVVPAMHSEMVNSQSVTSNLALLKRAGISILGPVEGDLAFGDVGNGRMVDLPVIVSHTQSFLNGNAPNLTGMKLVITAGGTEVPIDPVRLIANRSSGKLGHTLATIAASFGAHVTLISTRKPEYLHPNVTLISVKTPDQMAEATQSEFFSADALIMAAAVSDFSVKFSPEKLRRQEALVLTGFPTQDILANLSQQKGHQLIVGFCLESQDKLLAAARHKLLQKRCDVMIANAPESMGSDVRSAVVLFADSSRNPVHFTNVPLNKFSVHLLQEVFCDKIIR